jgi:hypothetical protein
MSMPVENSTSSNTFWSNAANNLKHPVAAGTAFIPVFYGFKVKYDLQIGAKWPAFNLIQSILGGVKTAPTVGSIVGIQLVAQKYFENLINPKQEPSAVVKLVSAAMVGTVSAPFLAILNEQVGNKTLVEAVKNLSFKPCVAQVPKEFFFVAGMIMSGPFGELMKERMGDNKGVEQSFRFLSGLAGGIMGHPFDTAITLWQSKKKVELKWKLLMRGAPVRGVTVGIFSVLYNVALDVLNRNKFD